MKSHFIKRRLQQLFATLRLCARFYFSASNLNRQIAAGSDEVPGKVADRRQFGLKTIAPSPRIVDVNVFVAPPN